MTPQGCGELLSLSDAEAPMLLLIASVNALQTVDCKTNGAWSAVSSDHQGGWARSQQIKMLQSQTDPFAWHCKSKKSAKASFAGTRHTI